MELKLINKIMGKNEQPQIQQLTPETLDQLWHEAEQLGMVEIDCEWNKRLYTAQIMFVRKSGTRIIAKGVSSDIYQALATVINEAREMGAGQNG